MWFCQQGFITSAEWDMLEGLLYTQDPVLMQAAHAWLEATDDDAQGGSEIAICQEFFGVITWVLDRELNQVAAGYTVEARRHVRDMVLGDLVSKADGVYLRDLLNQDDGDAVLLAAVEGAGESASVMDDPELLDSLQRLASRWRRVSPHTVLLDHLSALTRAGF